VAVLEPVPEVLAVSNNLSRGEKFRDAMELDRDEKLDDDDPVSVIKEEAGVSIGFLNGDPWSRLLL
jgi:hypothetical protein